ncbi:TIGR02452 family protein [Legionella fallonii]|uniref:Microbial-type PARG catalytic domain-containing protein n=1 Tax=Legionella fallonii LLAP-10 TaxID=1212491 RepID=A0A098G608_9GAMM|nr:TIGR02452 family protein [Legionella fallonii]CEG57401.1 protein of unknown function [Legionella fallonii LLAP-10]
MRSKLNLFKPTLNSFSIIKDVHAAHKPSFLNGLLSGNAWRHDSMGKTLELITDSTQYNVLQKNSEINIKTWVEKKSPSPLVVEVIHQDWGVATHEATKTYGTIYTVLNMANSLFPGGASLEGGSAQEENMWHRSTCARSLLDRYVYLDRETNTFLYNDNARSLLEAKGKMTNEELAFVKTRYPGVDSQGYRVFLSMEPRICFRGPEIILSNDIETNASIPDPELSYMLLPTSYIFPFYELRSAAPELISKTQRSVYESEEQYKMDLRQRIAAQLDTLTLAGQSHVILGAWGCGAFHNNPKLVAQIYSEEIEKRASFFQHILFPIINIGSRHNNYNIFNEYLDGIKLGDTYTATHSLKC